MCPPSLALDRIPQMVTLLALLILARTLLPHLPGGALKLSAPQQELYSGLAAVSR